MGYGALLILCLHLILLVGDFLHAPFLHPCRCCHCRDHAGCAPRRRPCAAADAARAGRQDRYVATIHKVGLDLGITQESALAWGVYAPVARLGPGDLSGNYAGAQGSASIGVGVGGNALVGGSANSIALQPLSVQGQVGLNVAAGLESLELRPGR